MSQAKDILFSLLSPKITELGYKFVKSKNAFHKIKNGLHYSIDSSWDGRGGLTVINHFSGTIKFPEVEKITQKMFGFPLNFRLPEPRFVYFDESLPQMYSRKLLESPTLKAMSEIPFEEKYPLEKIKNTADYIERKIFQDIIPFHNKFQSEKELLEILLKQIGERYAEGNDFGLMQDIAVAKIILKQMKQEEPDFLRAIDIFTKISFDESWNLQDFNAQESKKLFDLWKFRKS